ncbi:MAG: GNAT family N-acetyltransferase [Paracoccaceae bacterium]
MTLVIRPVTRKDEADWRKLWRAYLDFYRTERPDEVYAATWARIHDPDEDMHSLVAIRDGAAVGLAQFLYHRSFWDIANRCYLNDLYVTPQARGTGTGRALIEAVYADSDARNAAAVYWLTAEDNYSGRRLYDRLAIRTPFIKYQR